LLLGPQGWSDSNIDSGSAASLHILVRREIQKIRSGSEPSGSIGGRCRKTHAAGPC
jgi:hypothetical protein